MAYRALYREWRPGRFEDMVGQRHVTQTLLNALKQDKIAHAYLFSGPRGTGKTTAAKILAKALNCEQNPGDEPCNECAACRAVDQGNSMEVFEIDAASNRGIEEIRDLREKVKLSTAQGKYKVYIIDEVHMLTSEAFNALLKTLEEPPARVVFVLATTEAHKIPVTILSRVQRFEFHRIAISEIEARLAQVCEALQRAVKPEALRIIAYKAEGGLRDALSILDQCLLQEGEIGPEQVYDVLGMVGDEFSANLTEFLLRADYGGVIEQLNRGIDQGRDPRQILRELLEYLRQAMLYVASGQQPLTSPHLIDTLARQSKEAGLNKLLKWITVLLEAEGQLRYAANARLGAELLLIKTIYEGENSDLGSSAHQAAEQRVNAANPSAQNINRVSRQSAPVQEDKALAGSQASPVEGSVDRTDSISGSPADRGPADPAQALGQTAASAATFSAAPALTFAILEEQWAQVLEQVKKEKRSTHAFLIEARPAQVKNNQVIIAFKDGFSFHRDKLRQTENKQTVERALSAVFGSQLELVSVLEGELAAEPTGGSGAGSQEGKPLTDEEIVIRKATEIFGEEFVTVRKE